MSDAVDIKILSILQQHGRRHLAEIAKEVELSPPAVMERVKKLEARGIIKGYHAHLDAKKVGTNITAFVGVSITQQRYSDGFSSDMSKRKEVLECHHVTGDESFILKVKTHDTASLEKLLAEIHSMKGVSRSVTRVVLSTTKESQELPLTQLLEKKLEKEKGRAEDEKGKGLAIGLKKK